MSKKDSKDADGSLVVHLPEDKKYLVVKFEEKSDEKKDDSKPDDMKGFAPGIALFVFALTLILVL